MKVRLLKDVESINGPLKAGAIIDHPDAQCLVDLGVAEAVEE